MYGFDDEKLDCLVERFSAEHEHGPLPLVIDTYTGLVKAGISETIAQALTERVCENYYRQRELEVKRGILHVITQRLDAE